MGSKSWRADYSTVMQKSTFGFAPRGDAHFSYRITELLAAGTIPIVIDDDFMPPYGTDNITAWAVLLPEANIEHAESILTNISAREICEKKQEGANIYAKARSVEAMLEAMLVGLAPTVRAPSWLSSAWRRLKDLTSR